jgi:predicted dehydrogenase
MRIDFGGQLSDEPEIRAGFIGCGSHAFRNIYPTFQFTPVDLVATCDFAQEKAQAFAAQFGAGNAYNDYQTMLQNEQLDAVFVVTNYDEAGRPRYPQIAIDCMEAGCHVWIEKPPAASRVEIERMQEVSARTGRQVMVGLKKMFFPANRKARALSETPEFGATRLVTIQYPQYIPTVEEFSKYFDGRQSVGGVVSFLDHIAHPGALLLYLLGMPTTLYYERAANGAGMAVFNYASGAVASLVMTHGASSNGGLERTLMVSDAGQHIVVDNNISVQWHRPHPTNYGRTPDFFDAPVEAASVVWEPEFSLGQLYNKGLFLLGYYNEVNEFARSILEERPLSGGTLEQAHQIMTIFEAFAQGPGKVIPLSQA